MWDVRHCIVGWKASKHTCDGMTGSPLTPASGGFAMHTVVRFRPARLLRTARSLVVAGQRTNTTASRTAMILACLMIATGSPPAWAGLKSLKRVPIPLPPNLGDFVADRSAAIELGKALFWETQAGGDGVQACAQCHFQAGADVRVTNTLNPGANGVFDTAPAGATLNAGNFPINNGDVVGSQGIMKSLFVGLSGGPVDSCTPLADAVRDLQLPKLLGRPRE
ncbi:MAG: hypothetical protein E6J70_04555 [Deltaproteobacteria bacterium]|nr:MAG: hypothetical protein E6J70_04555 [Deltaproteobacteria bacterium]